jgi:dipeptidyl aminopeptidase/acylaminoacyl peptidase
MDKQKGIFAVLVTSLIIITPLVKAQEEKQSEREALYSLYATKMPVPYLLRKQLSEHIQRGIIEPHWMADGNSFWYVEGLPENTVIYVVDPKANTKKELFDVMRLREELASVLGHPPQGQGVPFQDFTFLDQEKKVNFNVEGKEFILERDTYTINKVSEVPAEEKQPPLEDALLSPNNLWIATIKDSDLWIRSTTDQSRIQITDDGIKDHYWSLEQAEWSPDSSMIALLKIDERNVHKIPIVKWLSTPEKVDWISYPRAGEPIPQREIYVVNVSSKQTVKVDLREEGDYWLGILGWRPDGSELFYKKVDRGWKEAEVMAANPIDGTSRIVLDDGVPPGPYWWPYGTFMLTLDGKKFILQSEKDGWDHLFLYNYKGKLVRQLTKGRLVIIRVVTLDEKTGWLYFTGRNDPERPYDTHLYRVNLNGKGFKRLTEAMGKHDGPYGWTDPLQAIQFTPSKEFFIDTHSTMNRPPIAELRKADGTLQQVLSKANIDILKERLKWSLPEEFFVKAADGDTDLYGAIYRPYDFNPNKKYPVIEIIYDDEAVQRTFIPNPFGWFAQALAHQGFIVFMVDVRGSGGRGRGFLNAFREEDFFGFIDDHVAALKQLAAERPYMDMSRVGLKGYSSGGPHALVAMLKAPDVYHVGIAGAPYYIDAYSLKATAIESMIGLLEENPEGYEKFSLLQYAGNLKGKLLFMHGTSDSACPLSHTMKMIDALIRSGKPYDLLIFPEETHGLFTRPGNFTYYLQATRRYFVEHLKPDIN